MHRVLQRLHDEHNDMWRLLEMLRHELANLERGEDIDAELMRDIVDYGASYTDIFHHPLEDVVYAKLVERAPQYRERVGQVGAEHPQLAALNHDFLNMLNALVAGDFVSRGPVEELTRRYITANQGHIRREDKEIFALAEEALSADDWADIETQLTTGENPLLGPQTQEPYLQRFARLTRSD